MSRFVVFLLMIIISGSVYGKTAKSTVILLSIDGFSYDYLSQYQPKNILAFAKSGVKAKLLPVYPSKTFPNHLSIITGVYPARHGIIHNRFYHPKLGEKYSLGAGKNDSTWLTAQPFWSFVEENNISSAVYFWPESEATGQGSLPSFNIPYNRKDSEKAHFDQIINWLKLPEAQAPQFIASYFSSVDDAGHKFGANSAQVKHAVAEIDKIFGHFISRLQKEIPQNVNVILLSDHGMMQIDKKMNINVTAVFDENLIKLITEKSMVVAQSSTQLYVYFDHEKMSVKKQASVFQSLFKKQSVNADLYTVYRKGNYPEHWQFHDDLAIIPDLILEAAANSSFTNDKYPSDNVATHGYDAKNQQKLSAIFLAAGPDIIQVQQLDAFENIHIVPLMSQLLGLKQIPHIDGNASVLAPIIKSH